MVYTRFLAEPQPTLLWTWSRQIRPAQNSCRIGFGRHYKDICAERETSMIIAELSVEPGDYVVDKCWYGAFFRTNLHDTLQGEEVDTEETATMRRETAAG